MRMRSTTLVLTALVVFSFAALAQGPTGGSISGTVSDSSGAVLPGVTVMATSPALLGEQTVITNDQGIYRFPLLPVGSYKLTYTVQGFNTVVRDEIVVKIGFNDTLNVTLGLATQQQTVVVMGETPLVDTQNSNLQNNFSTDQLVNIPNAPNILSLIAPPPPISLHHFDM